MELYSKILDKKKILPIICSKYNVIPSQIAYIGDDVNDLQIMKEIGFKVAPYDAVEKIKEISDYLCTLKGGEGAFRELSDLILKYNN